MEKKKSEGFQEAIARIEDNYQTKETHLDLAGLYLSMLPSKITKLEHLESLDLGMSAKSERTNFFKTFPLEIIDLKKLVTLNLSSNQLVELPRSIGELKELKSLYINSNQLTELPKEIGELKNLHLLYIDNNPLKNLPETISNLEKMQLLSLENTDLSELPKEIIGLNNLQKLWLLDNLKLNLPLEIVTKFDEPQTILNYYFENNYQTDEIKLPLKEVKVLLVGQGRVGKTSLVRYLVANIKRDPNEETTHGIFRTPWKIDVVEFDTKETHNVQLNLWDFGGQDIMHATHEFFLTERSLYLYVMDAGLSKEANRLEYWLKKIQTYSKNAPIFIVINKSESNKLEIPLKTLQETYNIKGLFEVSCDNGFNIDVLERKIKEQIGKMPEVFRRLNKSWFAVKEELEKIKQDYISIEDYRRICFEKEVIDSRSQGTLLTYLNELGIMLNFREDGTKVLNPEWVTRGVYKLITSVSVRNNKAILTPEIMKMEMKRLNAELAKEEKEYLSYPRDKYEYIIKLMKKFELCYEVQGTNDFYIPCRLEEDKPDNIGEWNDIECLGFRYDYGKGFLHESIMSRFIVKTHRLIVEKKQWLTGVVLVNEHGNMALIRADLTNGFIKILIDGNKSTRREFLAVIRNHFQDIHADIKHNKPIEEVPLDEFPDKFVEYEKLLQHESANINEFHENVDGRMIKVEINKLLNGLTTIERREKDRIKLQKIREEEKIYQAGLVEGTTSRLPIDINVNVYLYTPEREIKPIESRANLVEFANLQRLQSKKEVLDVQADSTGSKKAIAVITVSFIIHITSFVVLILLIFVFSEDGWGKFESWTFAIFLGLEIVNSLGNLAFFIKTRQDFSWSTYCSWMIEKEKTKLYLKHNIDDKEIEELKGKLNSPQ